MDSWDRDQGVEKRLLLNAADTQSIAHEHALSLHRFSASRTLPGPVRLGGRSLLQDTAEELADAANYLRWESVRATEDGNDRWSHACCLLLGDVLRAWRSLEQAAVLADALDIPNTGLTVGDPTE